MESGSSVSVCGGRVWTGSGYGRSINLTTKGQIKLSEKIFTQSSASLSVSLSSVLFFSLLLVVPLMFLLLFAFPNQHSHMTHLFV